MNRLKQMFENQRYEGWDGPFIVDDDRYDLFNVSYRKDGKGAGVDISYTEGKHSPEAAFEPAKRTIEMIMEMHDN